MRTNAPDSRTKHTYTREAERTQGYTHMEACSMEPDGLRTGCERVPLHVIQVFLRLLSVPFLFDCVISRLDAGPSNYVARTVCGAESAPDHLLKELLQVVPVKGSPASYALSISDKQGCDCYSVGAVARDLEALAGADELGRVELAGDERAWRESLAERHDHVHALAHVAQRLQLLLGSTISLPVGGVVLWLLPVKRQLVVLCGG